MEPESLLHSLLLGVSVKLLPETSRSFNTVLRTCDDPFCRNADEDVRLGFYDGKPAERSYRVPSGIPNILPSHPLLEHRLFNLWPGVDGWGTQYAVSRMFSKLGTLQNKFKYKWNWFPNVLSKMQMFYIYYIILVLSPCKILQQGILFNAVAFWAAILDRCICFISGDFFSFWQDIKTETNATWCLGKCGGGILLIDNWKQQPSSLQMHPQKISFIAEISD